MPKGLLFWMVFILVVFLCMFFNYDMAQRRLNWGTFGGFGVILFLIFLLGWAVFGFVVQ